MKAIDDLRGLPFGSEESESLIRESLVSLWEQQGWWKGKIDLLEHLVHVLIATHPAPEKAYAFLQQARPGLVDSLIDGESSCTIEKATRDAWMEGLVLTDALFEKLLASRASDAEGT